MANMIPFVAPLVAGSLALAAPAAAEVELSFYTGWQTAPHSRVSGDLPGGGGSYNELFAWEGRSGQLPPYYGVRATWWRSDKWGFGLEFSHNKAYANDSDREALGFSNLEFTDGLNIVTLNATRRWKDQWGSFTPYVGGGIGVAVPHVDVTHDPSGSSNYEFQFTGPAMRLTAGTSYKINDRYSVFGEYQFTYSSNEVELDNGGSLNTDIKTNALNIGLSLSF